MTRSLFKLTSFKVPGTWIAALAFLLSPSIAPAQVDSITVTGLGGNCIVPSQPTTLEVDLATTSNSVQIVSLACTDSRLGVPASVTIQANSYSGQATFTPPSHIGDEIVQINATLAGTRYGGQTAVVQASEITTVQGVTATACPAGVDVKWAGLPLVTNPSYYVFRSTSAQPDDWTQLNAVVARGFLAFVVPLTGPEFFDASAAPGASYNYKVVLGINGSAQGTTSITVPTSGSALTWIATPSVSGTVLSGTISFPGNGAFSAKLFCNGYMVGTLSPAGVMEANPNYASFNVALDGLSKFVGRYPSSFCVVADQNGYRSASSLSSLLIPSSPWSVARNDDVLEAQLGEAAFCDITYFGATSWTYSISNSSGSQVFSTSGVGQHASVMWDGGTTPSDTYTANLTFQTSAGP